MLERPLPVWYFAAAFQFGVKGPVAPSADFYRRDAASPLDVPVESDVPTLPSTFYAPVESATESATVRGVRASRFLEPRSPVR